MYLIKRKSRTRENKSFKWIPDCNRNAAEVLVMANRCGAFPIPKNEGDYVATLIIIDICLEEGEFWEFGEYLVYGKA